MATILAACTLVTALSLFDVRLGLVLPTCIAFATLVLCAAAAAELSTASDVARFCRDSASDVDKQ